MSESLTAQPKRDNGLCSLVIPLVIKEDMVVLMIVLQDLKQGFLGLRACPRECMGTQSRGGKPRWCREQRLCDVWRGYFGGSGLVSSEQVANCGSHLLLLSSS